MITTATTTDLKCDLPNQNLRQPVCYVNTSSRRFKKQLDDVIDPDLLYEHAIEQFVQQDCPSAGAFYILQDLDLGPALTGQKNSRGEISFHDGDTPVSSFRGVTVRDLNSVSLLQVRLNELETGWQIMELPEGGKSRSEVIEITM